MVRFGDVVGVVLLMGADCFVLFRVGGGNQAEEDKAGGVVIDSGHSLVIVFPLSGRDFPPRPKHIGVIDFEEFATVLLTMMVGEREEKLRVGFSLMDQSGTGTVNRADLVDVVAAFASTLSSMGLDPGTAGFEVFVDELLEVRGLAVGVACHLGGRGLPCRVLSLGWVPLLCAAVGGCLVACSR